MSDAATLAEALARLAAADPRRRRFGAARHGYQLGAPLGAARLAAIEATLGVALPPDYRAHVGACGDGGAGPGHGLVRLDHPTQLALALGACPLPAEAAPFRGSPWRGVVALADLGCGYLALLVVRGPARGTVWADARSAGLGVVPLADGFAAFYLDWLARAGAGAPPREVVPAGVCALPAALSAYLARAEAAAGVAPGALDGAALREALEALPAGGIALAATGDDPIFTAGTPVTPCLACARLLEQLAGSGLAPDVVALGQTPLAAP